jgi:hypothetical protein
LAVELLQILINTAAPQGLLCPPNSPRKCWLPRHTVCRRHAAYHAGRRQAIIFPEGTAQKFLGLHGT